MRKISNNYFHFTKKERNGIMVLLFLVVVLNFLPRFFKTKSKPIDNSKLLLDLSLLQEKQQGDSNSFNKMYYKYADVKRSNYSVNEVAKAALFYFDPNTLSADGWKKLGVQDKTIHTIQNYIAKGGKFKEASELKKIWGLKFLADKLIPFVKIEVNINDKQYDSKIELKHQKEVYVKKSYRPIDVNNADSALLSQLPGIGAKLSQRIIHYRNKLGGFINVDQVAETFGLSDSTFNSIRPYLNIDRDAVKQININATTIEALKSHPYIRYHLANAIIQYQKQHGNFKQVDDIRHIMLVNDSIYNKVSPYLSIE